MTVTIYLNPDCGTSRNTLDIIRQSGVEPTVVRLRTDAGLTVREALRRKDTPFEELGLGDAAKSEDEMLDAIEQHPILLNLPFVVTSLGTRLRPSEVVLDILENPDIGPFTKEDGEVVINDEGLRIV